PLKKNLSVLSPNEDEILKALNDDPLNPRLTINQIHQKVRSKVRRGKEWVRQHTKRLVEEGYVNEDQTKPPYVYYASDLDPEKLSLEVNSPDRILKNWMTNYGWTLLPRESASTGFDLAELQVQLKTGSWSMESPKSFQEPGYWKIPSPTTEFTSNTPPNKP